MFSTPTEIAVGFLRQVTAGKIAEAYAQYIHPDFRHHNPWFASSAAALQQGMQENAAKFPQKTYTVLRTIAEGDTVAVHGHVQLQPDTPGIIVVHIARIHDNKIVELWDIAQPIPEQPINTLDMR